MTTSTAPSVINPDIPPLPRPEVLASPEDCSLSPENSASAPNKCSRTVSANNMDIETTSPSTPAFGSAPNNSSGLPINKVIIITRPNTADSSLDSSIHAQPRPTPTEPSGNNDKGKFVVFDVPVRQPSPDSNAAAIKSSPSRFHVAAYLRDAPTAFKEKFTTNRTMSLCVTKWIEPSLATPLMVLELTVKDQETTKESLSSSLSKTIIPHASNSHMLIYSIWSLPSIHLQMYDVVMKKNLCSLLTFLFP
ncbi:unnamed protein product [Rhizophagus irregularis]|nr:unnamed protein product [Rhizophagus irregularis]